MWRAKHRIDEATGELDQWLREPEVKRGIQFACEANDEKFFAGLGRILTAKPKTAKLLPIATLFGVLLVDDALEFRDEVHLYPTGTWDRPVMPSEKFGAK